MKIDPNKESKLGKVIEVIADHDNCLDIFRDILDYVKVKQEGEDNMKIKVDPQQFIRMKMETHSRQKI